MAKYLVIALRETVDNIEILIGGGRVEKVGWKDKQKVKKAWRLYPLMPTVYSIRFTRKKFLKITNAS